LMDLTGFCQRYATACISQRISQSLGSWFESIAGRQLPRERLIERDARQPVATEQMLPKAIGPDSASVRGGLGS
jgi:hypothetical protein